AGADHMVPHDVVGPLCVRANNSSYDLVVLMKGVLCSARNKLKRLKGCEPLPETTSHRGNTWIMRAQINSLMKFIVHCCEIFVAIRDSPSVGRVENLGSFSGERSHSDNALFRTKPLKFAKGFKHIIQLFDVDTSNRNPLSRRNLDQTSSAQAPKSFADRGSRYTKLSADAWLIKPRAGFNLAGQDGFYKCLENFV